MTRLIKLIKSQHSHVSKALLSFPQNEDIDHYIFALVKRNISTKMGLAFTKGEIILVDPESRFVDSFVDDWSGETEEREFVTAWSVRNKCLTSILNSDVEWI